MINRNTVPFKSPLSDGLQNIHKVITRGLDVTIMKCEEYDGKPGIPSKEKDGFLMYVTTLIRVTHAHHLGEDDVAFPYFKDLISAPFGRLKDDHKSITGVLDKMEQYLTEVSSGKVDRFRLVLEEFRSVWIPHIKIEEEHFSAEKILEAMSMEEQINLIKKIGEHSSKTSGPGPITLPFVFYNVEGRDRMEFTKDLPWLVKRILVPIVWRNRWKPMVPFFLSN